MDSVFAQVCVLGSSLVLMCGLILLWRRGVTAYITAFTWQSIVLSGLTAVVGYFGNDRELYWVAAALAVLKAVIIPRLLRRMERRFQAERELQPYVNTQTSLVIAGLLVLFGYAITRPLVALSQLPTRAGMPLAMGLVLVSLFVVISRKKALTQVVGFLMLENALALDYPDGRLEILVAADGCSDETEAIVRRYEARGVRLLHRDTHKFHRFETSLSNLVRVAAPASELDGRRAVHQGHAPHLRQYRLDRFDLGIEWVLEQHAPSSRQCATSIDTNTPRFEIEDLRRRPGLAVSGRQEVERIGIEARRSM